MRSLSDKLPDRISAVEQFSIEKLLSDSPLGPEKMSFTVLAGDGSERNFLRVTGDSGSMIVVLPDSSADHGLAEANSAWLIGRHLQACEVPVPQIYGFDQETGVLLCEDLGEGLLHRLIIEEHWSEEQVSKIYMEAIDLLVHMQVVGVRGFSANWCWDSPEYDRSLMLARESGYFLESYCRQLLGISDIPAELEPEFVQLADLAASPSTEYFLHRDFQSRNLMIKDNRLRVLDFQGGRRGPLGYDLASLLIDPYVSLPDRIINKLLSRYQEVAAELTGLDMAGFSEGYYWLSLQRNLQILGAFAFLYKEKGKVFFRDYLRPATESLIKILDEPPGRCFPSLRAITAEFPERLDEVL
jgi:aminoglycoside/choline kinase family phosphotransferase